MFHNVKKVVNFKSVDIICLTDNDKKNING